MRKRFVKIIDGGIVRFVNTEKIAEIALYQSGDLWEVVIFFSKLENEMTFDGTKIRCKTREDAEKIIAQLLGDEYIS